VPLQQTFDHSVDCTLGLAGACCGTDSQPNTNKCDCDWEIDVSWVSSGRSGIITVDDGDHPFRTTSDVRVMRNVGWRIALRWRGHPRVTPPDVDHKLYPEWHRRRDAYHASEDPADPSRLRR
jgi:hypothetical protein